MRARVMLVGCCCTFGFAWWLMGTVMLDREVPGIAATLRRQFKSKQGNRDNDENDDNGKQQQQHRQWKDATTDALDYEATIEVTEMLQRAITAKQENKTNATDNNNINNNINNNSNNNCPNGGSGYPTSLKETIKAFSINNKTQQLFISQSSFWPVAAVSTTKLARTEQQRPRTSIFVPIDFIFQAHNDRGEPQTAGGDLFVLDMQAWYNLTDDVDTLTTATETNATTTIVTTSFRTAAFSKELPSGRYKITLHLPTDLAATRDDTVHADTVHADTDTTADAVKYNLTLRHYYTCYDGIKQVSELAKPNGFHPIDAGGPRTLALDQMVLGVENRNNKAVKTATTFKGEGSKLPTTTTVISTQEDILMSILTRAREKVTNNDDHDDELSLNKGTMMAPPATPPPCRASQQGVDEVGKGVWMQEGPEITYPNEMELDATWLPLYCKPTPPPRPTVTHLRMGDSTMPRTPWGQIGVPFAPYLTFWGSFREHHDKYVSVLWNEFGQQDDDDNNDNDKAATTSTASTTTSLKNSTFLLSHGLWHLLHAHFNPAATANLVLRSVCQVALRFPGKMILQAIVPIQQHLLDDRVDVTSQNVQIVNSILRRAIRPHAPNGDPCDRTGTTQQQHEENKQQQQQLQEEARLSTLCADRDDLHVFVSIANETSGDEIVPMEAAKLILKSKYNYSMVDSDNNNVNNKNDNETQLVQWISNLSRNDRLRLYGNRTLWFFDLESVLLSRPETYRDHDKIHDLRAYPGRGYMWDAQHSSVLAIVESLRSLGPE